MENLRPLLIRALEIDVAIQKGTSKLAAFVHENADPDFGWMEGHVAMMVGLVAQWTELRLVIEGKPHGLADLANGYFRSLDIMGSLPDTFKSMVLKSRKRIADGQVPTYKPADRWILEYDPQLYHNAETWALATELEVSLD